MTRAQRAIVVLLAGGVVCGWQASGFQPPGSAPQAGTQAEAQARRATDRIRALQRESDALAARERTLLGDLRGLEIERDLRREQYDQGARELARISGELDAMSARIDTLQQQARFQLPDLSGRLADLYKLGNAGYVRMLLNLEDLRDMGRAYRFVSALQSIDRQRLREYERTMDEMRRAKTSLEERQARQAAVQQDMAAARDAAGKAAARLAAMVDDIDARRDLNARFVGELQAAHQQLQQAIVSMAGAPGQGEAAAPVALPLPAFKGDLGWPVTGRVASAFGRQTDPRFLTAVASNGVVVEAADGTPVLAVHEGTVAFAEPFTGFGNLVIIDHGNLAFSLYGHLAAIDTPVGTRVTSGQPLGTVGPLLDGTPALYFELRIDGKAVDPLQWLRKQR